MLNPERIGEQLAYLGFCRYTEPDARLRESVLTALTGLTSNPYPLSLSSVLAL